MTDTSIPAPALKLCAGGCGRMIVRMPARRQYCSHTCRMRGYRSRQTNVTVSDQKSTATVDRATLLLAVSLMLVVAKTFNQPDIKTVAIALLHQATERTD